MPKKERVGIVVSNKMNDSVAVEIVDFSPMPKYKKIIARSKNYIAHTPENMECNEGDKVRMVETRPLSKTKRWRVVEIIERVS